MIGRAARGNPWIFNEIKNYLKGNHQIKPPSLSDKIETVKKHLDFSIQWKGEKLGLIEMRRHYTNYFKGIPHFKEYRMKMVTSDDATSVFNAFDEVEAKFGNMIIPQEY